MTFGNLKSIIEKNLLESYSDEKDFKKSLREFKHNVLNNKSMSKAYALYDQLSTPQGLSEQDAKEFLLKTIESKYNIDRKNICYFGDDLFDIGIMKEVGYSFCTSDSPLIVKLHSIELNVFGGNNAVLHLFEYIEKSKLIPSLTYEEIMSKIYELDKKEKF